METFQSETLSTLVDTPRYAPNEVMKSDTFTQICGCKLEVRPNFEAQELHQEFQHLRTVQRRYWTKHIFQIKIYISLFLFYKGHLIFSA